MLKLTVKKDTIPSKFVVPPENELLVVAAMGDQVQRNVYNRLRVGRGAHGALPTDMVKTGRLLNSISYSLRTGRKGNVTAIVSATGDRPTDEVGQKKQVASRRTKLARAAHIASGTARTRRVKSKKAPSGFAMKFMVSHIRHRAATTNAALAAILSVPPKSGDKRGFNGKRGTYVVFDVNSQDINDVQQIVGNQLNPSIRSR